MQTVPLLTSTTAVSGSLWGSDLKKKTFFKNIEKFRYNFIKNEIIYMDLTFIYKTPIILSLSKTVALIFTNHILTHLHHLHLPHLHHAYFNELRCSSKVNVIGK